MRKNLLIVILLVLAANIFAVGFNDFEKSKIDELQALRMELKAYYTTDDAVQQVEAFAQKLNSIEDQKLIGKEAKLLLDSIIGWEIYNWHYEVDPKSEKLKTIMLELHSSLKNYIKNNENSDINPWIYSCAGDITSSTLQYLSKTDAMKEGLAVKKYYEIALEKDSQMSWALMDLAQWYFHAPAFAGGGKRKALSYFEKALDASKTQSEIFFSKIFLSQGLYENDKTVEAATMLESLQELVPNSNYIKFLQRLNKAGYSLFYYTVNREKVDEKLNLQAN